MKEKKMYQLTEGNGKDLLARVAGPEFTVSLP